MESRPAVLEGVRVVEWGLFHVGPSAGAMLADLGAEVIHVEKRQYGDPLRGLSESRGVSYTLPGGRQVIFEDVNRNKKSIAIDLTKERGKEVIYRLVAKSDVFLTNFRHNAAVKLGLEYETLSQHNPRLIYASSTTFGERGPEKNTPGLELLGYARSGVMMASGEEGMPPVLPAIGIGDRIGGVYLAYGTLAALLAREKLGIGQKVTTSILGGMIALQSATVMTELLKGTPYPRLERRKAKNPIYSYYKCRDERWIALGLLQSDRHWSAFCKGLDMPELEQDPRFHSAEKRGENCEELVALLDRVIATRDCWEWERRFKEAGDLLISRVNTISQLASDPQVLSNDYIVELDHPSLGQVKVVGFPMQLSETPASIRSVAPQFGQHTEEVLVEVCGYTWQEISDLQEQAVI